MAVVDPAQPALVTTPVQPNQQLQPIQSAQTVPDKVRLTVGLVLIALGVAFIALGVIVLAFPAIGGQSGPLLQYGSYLALTGVGVIWDRQTPIFKLP